jgi:hypothetical protein
MQCKIRRESRSRGLDTAFRYAPDLLGRRSLPYLNSIGPKRGLWSALSLKSWSTESAGFWIWNSNRFPTFCLRHSNHYMLECKVGSGKTSPKYIAEHPYIAASLQPFPNPHEWGVAPKPCIQSWSNTKRMMSPGIFANLSPSTNTPQITTSQRQHHTSSHIHLVWILF